MGCLQIVHHFKGCLDWKRFEKHSFNPFVVVLAVLFAMLLPSHQFDAFYTERSPFQSMSRSSAECEMDGTDVWVFFVLFFTSVPTKIVSGWHGQTSDCGWPGVNRSLLHLHQATFNPSRFRFGRNEKGCSSFPFFFPWARMDSEVKWKDPLSR